MEMLSDHTRGSLFCSAPGWFYKQEKKPKPPETTLCCIDMLVKEKSDPGGTRTHDPGILGHCSNQLSHRASWLGITMHLKR